MSQSSSGAGLQRRARSTVWNGDEQRFRMPIRIIAGIAIWATVGIAVGGFIEFTLTGRAPLINLRTSYIGSVAASLIQIVTGGAATVTAIYLAGRYVDRRPLSDFGLRINSDWWRDLAFGFGLGGVLMTGIFVFELAMGWVTITGFFTVGGQPGWTFPFWFAVAVARYGTGSVAEELLHRGLLLTNLAEGLQVGPFGERGAVAGAVALTSGVFALAHATAPNASTISTASIALAGVLLALGYVLTGELAISIGLHIAWNFFEGNIYGFPISGSATTSLISTTQSGPALITGGAFGPEAGLIGVVAILLGIGAIVGWAQYTRGAAGVHPALTTPELRK